MKWEISMALFKGHPQLRWQPKQGEQVIPLDVQEKYPDFADDFAFLEQALLSHFRIFDNEALRAQNQFRLDQVILIVGSALVTILGAVQIALTQAIWPGVVEASLAALLVALGQRTRAIKAQERYFTNRLKAELLRGEYHRFLGRIGPYADGNHRVQLVRRVAE